MTRSNMCVEVSFLAGTDLEDCIQEAKDKAIMWDVAYVKFNFNSQKFSVKQSCDVEGLLTQWELEPERNYFIGL